MLALSFRVRDLVHGYVYLTDLERNVINHGLFQRLRHIRQNDVAFFVYPSLNISRFEHSVGCAAVAGKMAASLLRSLDWPAYRSEIGLSEDDFLQVCRLYALLHDIGHLPLSHLFEMAFEDFAAKQGREKTLREMCSEWFGGEGFDKLHEACGSRLVVRLLNDLACDPKIRNRVEELTSVKRLAPENVLVPVKQLIDSEIDADRIDSTARDGALAGGEYGTYNIDRICSAAFLHRAQAGWRLAYSHKALASIEALLFDRCRTHTWIHFHPRVVALKGAARVAISHLLVNGDVTANSFPVDNPPEMALRDDVWLWDLIRRLPESKDEGNVLSAARRALLYRSKGAVCLLWKNRAKYHHAQEQLRQVAEIREVPFNRLGRPYEEWLSERLGTLCRIYVNKFSPLGKRKVILTEDGGSVSVGELADLSTVVSSLTDVWRMEPQYHLILFGTGEISEKKRSEFTDRWVQATSEWLHREEP